MKKIILFALPILLLAACSKQDANPRQPIDESYWLGQERGIVSLSDPGCDYFVIETYNGFSLVRNWGGFAPLPGTVVYGDFSRFGLRTIYNRSEGYLMQAEVREYWLPYWDAIDQMNWNCSQR